MRHATASAPRPAVRPVAGPAPLALVRDDAPALLAFTSPAHRWRRLVGRRRGASVAVALVYLGGVCCVAALGAHLLPAAGLGEP